MFFYFYFMSFIYLKIFKEREEEVERKGREIRD